MHGCCWFYLFTDVLICSDRSSRLLKAEEYSHVVFTSVQNGKSALCSKPHGATQFCRQGLHHKEGSKDTGKHPWRKGMTYDCPGCARPFTPHRPQLKPRKLKRFHVIQVKTSQLPATTTALKYSLVFHLGNKTNPMPIILSKETSFAFKTGAYGKWARQGQGSFLYASFPAAHVPAPMVLTALAEDIVKSPGVCALTVLLTFLTYMTLSILHRDPGKVTRLSRSLHRKIPRYLASLFSWFSSCL